MPKPGARVDLPLLAGSADALALAELAVRNKGRTLAVVTASAADAQRLLDEIPWFAPGLKVRLLPDWETLPYDHFSPHQDLVSERLATLWAALQGEVEILLVPASTANGLEADGLAVALAGMAETFIDRHILQVAPQGSGHGLTQHQRGAGRRIHLVTVVGFDNFNIDGIAKGLGCQLQQLQRDVDAHQNGADRY